MDSRKLGYFLAVAEHGGFTSAAAELAVSQPAVSHAVHDLERELGTELFVRLGRSIRLTPAGEALVAPARRTLAALESGRQAVAAVAGVEAGSLTLSCLPTLAVDPTAPLIGAFRRARPGVSVELIEPEDSSEILALLRDGRCELAFTERARFPDDLVEHPVIVQELYVTQPPGSVDPGDSVALADLAGSSFVATPRGTSSRRLLDEALEQAGVTPSVAVTTAQREALLHLVLTGAGVALLPQPLAHLAGRLGAVISRPVPRVTRHIVLVHRTGPLTPAAEAFVSLAVRP